MRSDEHETYLPGIAIAKSMKLPKHFWEVDCNYSCDQKNVVDMESKSIPRKIKETIHSLKNPNNIKKISHILAMASQFE